MKRFEINNAFFFVYFKQEVSQEEKNREEKFPYVVVCGATVGDVPLKLTLHMGV